MMQQSTNAPQLFKVPSDFLLSFYAHGHCFKWVRRRRSARAGTDQLFLRRDMQAERRLRVKENCRQSESVLISRAISLALSLTCC